jgi:hypothetical protein
MEHAILFVKALGLTIIATNPCSFSTLARCVAFADSGEPIAQPFRVNPSVRHVTPTAARIHFVGK